MTMEEGAETIPVQFQNGSLIDRLPAFVWIVSPDGSMEFANQRWCDYTGLNLYEAAGTGWLSAAHPNDIQNSQENWRSIQASGRPGEMDVRLRRSDGEFRWFHINICPASAASRPATNWCGVGVDIDERKRADESKQDYETLIESEQQFRTLFEEAGAGITILDLHEVVPVHTNKAMQKMLGCTAEELSWVETFTELTAEQDRDQDQALFIELRQGKRDVLRQEKHFILKDGRSVWANGTFTLLRDAAGTPRSVISIHEEITERKLALEKLQAYQDLLELAQKSAGAMAFDWYVNAEINYWSPEQEGLFGLASGTFDGTFKTWKKMMYPPDWPVVVEAIKRAEQTGEVVAEYRVIWPDGSLHWLATNGRMFFDDKGEPFRMVGFTSDVTRRKLAEEELRRSEAFLAEGQHLARTGNFSWNVTTEELMWSEQLRRIFEFEPGVPVSLELIASRVHPDDIGMMHDMVDRARRGVSDFEYEHRLLMPDDSVKHLHLIAHRARSDAGGIEYIGAVQDVTQRRISEEALGEARSELARVARFTSLGVLTASIAHEVNQPLSGIITNANTCVRMLDADPPNVDGARETARRTIRDGNRASEVITRLRALFGKKEFTSESLNLNEAVQEVIALSHSDLRRTQIVLQTNFHRNLPLIEGDRVQLQQVILNLIRNATDAMCAVDDRPRRMLIATEIDAGAVLLRVKDSGTGLDPKATNQLFDAFYTTKDEGMGIGLSVSKSIIEGHQGHLWATPNDGPGTTFSFSIPYAPNAPEAGHLTSRPEDPNYKDEKNIARTN
jgi:PAS domain S-box-containing protein